MSPIPVTMWQACVNGARRPVEHPALPVSAAAIGAACADAVAAGASDLHVHPKNMAGQDTLDPVVVGEVLTAVRLRCPGISVGITTGAWAEASDRIATVTAWSTLPDHASVNFHEPGATELAHLLLERGIAVDAGLYTASDGCDELLSSGLATSCRYLLVEVTHTDTNIGLAEAAGITRRLQKINRPLLLHGEEPTAWPVLREALRLGLATRIGLEDVLDLPDGVRARDNADLIRAATPYFSGVRR